MPQNKTIKHALVFIKKLFTPWRKLLGFIFFVLYAILSFVREVLPLDDAAKLQIGRILEVADWYVWLIIGLIFAWLYTAWQASGKEMEDEPIWANLFIKPSDYHDLFRKDYTPPPPQETATIRIDRFGGKSVTSPVITLQSRAWVEDGDRPIKHSMSVKPANRLFKDIIFTEENLIGDGKPIWVNIATVIDGHPFLLLENGKEQLPYPHQMVHYEFEVWVGGKIGDNSIVTQSFMGVMTLNSGFLQIHERGEKTRRGKWVFRNRPAKDPNALAYR